MLWLWTVVSGAAAFSVFLWIAFQIYYCHALQLCRGIPSAQPCYPFLGNILLFACSFENMPEKVLQVIRESVLSGLRASCFWFCAYPIIIIYNPDDIKKVLNNSVCKGEEIEEGSKFYTKYGLLTSPVDHWKVTRRHLNASFHPRNLERLMPVFNSTSRQLLDELSGHVGGKAVDLMPIAMLAALRNICIFLYGPQVVQGMTSENFEDLRHVVELVGELMALRSTLPWLRNDIVFKLFYGKEINFIRKTFHATFKIASQDSVKGDTQGVKEGANVNFSHRNTEHESRFQFQTILDALYELKEKFSCITNQHIEDELVSFFAAGTDTIGASVSSCLLALACLPHVQNKVYEEISSVLSEDEEIAQQNLNSLTYLDQVIKETLRFFMVVPLTSRAPNKDIHLGGYTIPANKTAYLFLAGAGMDSKNFRDPHKFDPDRFSTKAGPEISNFIPFSRGPRNCIGKDYSMILMKIMVAQVIRKYELSTNMHINHLKKRFMVTMTSRDGYHIFLKKRSM